MPESDCLKVLAKVLPELLWRHKWSHYGEVYGVPYTQGTMQNYDSQGIGPEYEVIGGRVCYYKPKYLRWLATRGQAHAA